MNDQGNKHANKQARLTALVMGAVQGVGYRRYVQRRAKDLLISGYAENLPGGAVEVVAEGWQQDLEQLLHHIWRGPAHARVERVEVLWSEAAGLTDFYAY